MIIIFFDGRLAHFLRGQQKENMQLCFRNFFNIQAILLIKINQGFLILALDH